MISRLALLMPTGSGIEFHVCMCLLSLRLCKGVCLGITHVSTLSDAFLFSSSSSATIKLARDPKESVDWLIQGYGRQGSRRGS